MKAPLSKTTYLLSVALAVVCLLTFGTSAASAQQTDVYQINYFTVSDVSEAAILQTYRIDNPGLTYGNLCAMIYVFAADQQMAECCGCIETHNGLRTLSILDLLSNPLTGVTPPNGVIKIVSAAVNNSPCDPSANVRPTPNLRAWGTHVQLVGTRAITINETETEFVDSPLGATELANLQAQCSFIHILGSGHGLCTCGTGD